MSLSFAFYYSFFLEDLRFGWVVKWVVLAVFYMVSGQNIGGLNDFEF